MYIRAAVQLDRAGWPGSWTTPPSSLEEAALSALAAIVGHPPPVGAEILVYSALALDDVVLRRLTQPADPGLPESERGLGYGDDEAERIFCVLVDEIDATGRSILVDPPPGEMSLPGADYDDRCMWGLFRAAMNNRPDASPLLVTDDRAFALQINSEAERVRGVSAPWVAVSSARFCELLTRYR